MTNLLDSRTPMGPFGWYVSRTSGIEQWPELSTLDVADRQIVEEVQKGLRRWAIIRTRTNDLLFEHYEYGNAPPPEEGKRWGYRVFHLPPPLVVEQPRDQLDTKPSASSRRFSAGFAALATLAGLSLASLLGVGVSFGLLSSQINSIAVTSDKLSKKGEELGGKTDTILANTEATIKSKTSPVQPTDSQIAQRNEKRLSAIEQQTKAAAIKETLANYLAEIASDGDDSLLMIVNKLRSGKCTSENWKTCKQ